jgi:cell division protein ZapA (FtsZ GTPase activity inhibitor)
MSEFSISITVADRPYKLVVEKEQEEMFRNAAKLIDKRIKEYSSSYAFKDKQDLLAMIALEYTVSFLQNEQTTNESELLLNDKLTGIDNALNELLKSPLA